MDSAAAAQLKTVLVGVALPAQKQDLLAYAVQQHAEPQLLDALRTLPEGKKFESLDAVAEELVHVQPDWEKPVPPEPNEESGRPPGGDAYTDQDPDTGTVRS